MKRLIKKSEKRTSYDFEEKVRFIDNARDGLYTVMSVNGDTYNLLSSNNEVIPNVKFDEIVGEDEFVPGDKVIYETHPYDNINPFEVKEVLQDGTYFIENKNNAYTGINGKNLKLLQN